MTETVASWRAKRYRKAIAGAVTAGVVMLLASLDHGGITADEWAQIAGAVLAGFTGVAVAPRNNDMSLRPERRR